MIWYQIGIITLLVLIGVYTIFESFRNYWNSRRIQKSRYDNPTKYTTDKALNIKQKISLNFTYQQVTEFRDPNIEIKDLDTIIDIPAFRRKKVELSPQIEIPNEKITKYILEPGVEKRNQILIIDDDKAMCQLLEKLLDKKYEVITKNDGMSAMYWLVEGNIPDLIITDLDMPYLNGEEFIKNLKRSNYYKGVPLIIITGFDNKKQKVRLMKLGVHDFFVKPFNPKDLLFSVEVGITAVNEQYNKIKSISESGKTE